MVQGQTDDHEGHRKRKLYTEERALNGEMKVGDMQGGSKQKMNSDRTQEDRCYKQGWGAQNEIIRGGNPTDHKKLKSWK